MSLIQQLLHNYGYLAVAIGVGVESTGIPLPGETILIAAATYAGATGRLSVFVVVLTAAAAGIVGDNLGYWAGRGFGGRALDFLDRHLHRRADALHNVEQMFDRHDGQVVLFGRFVPVVRTYVAFGAGARAMPWSRFLIYNFAGVVAWAAIIGFGSAELGSTIGTWGTYALSAAVIVVVAAATVWHRWRTSHRSAAVGATGT